MERIGSALYTGGEYSIVVPIPDYILHDYDLTVGVVDISGVAAYNSGIRCEKWRNTVVVNVDGVDLSQYTSYAIVCRVAAKRKG